MAPTDSSHGAPATRGAASEGRAGWIDGTSPEMDHRGFSKATRVDAAGPNGGRHLHELHRAMSWTCRVPYGGTEWVTLRVHPRSVELPISKECIRGDPR